MLIFFLVIHMTLANLISGGKNWHKLYIVCANMVIVYELQIGWDSVMRMDKKLQNLFIYEAFLYYNPLLLLVRAFCFCWLLCVFMERYMLNFLSSLCLSSINLMLQTLMVWLWGVNLWVFAQSTVNYSKIFDLDLTHLTHREIWKVLKFLF